MVFVATVMQDGYSTVPHITGEATNVEEFLKGTFFEESFCGPLYRVDVLGEEERTFVLAVRRSLTSVVLTDVKPSA